MDYYSEEDWDDDYEEDYFDISLNSSASSETCASHSKPTPKPSSNTEEKVRRGPQSNLKVEMKNVYLANDSRNLIMDALRSVHGQNFSLEDDETPVTSKRDLSHQYWMNQGQLVVRNVYNYSNRPTIDRDKVNSFALENLELYGFYTNHCCEALLEANNDFENALKSLLSFYFGINFKSSSTTSKNISEREDEIVALKSIYDAICEERVPNKHWVFHLDLPHLAEWYFVNLSKKNSIPTTARRKPMCRNFEATGKCRFGSSCKFSHETRNSNIDTSVQEMDLKLKSSFNLEVRFPDDCNYPEDVPLLIFSAEHKEFSSHACLRITKLLLKEASSCAEHGSPYCYNIIEILLSTDHVVNWLNNESVSQLKISRDASLLNLKTAQPLPESNSSGEIGKPWLEGPKEKKNTEAENVNRDEELIKMLKDKQNNEKFRNIQKYRRSLPAWCVGQSIFEALNKHQVIVVVGETGCGKSTQVPQFILDEWLYSKSGLWNHRSNYNRVNIICTQPRRLSAIGVASRVAEERIEKPGESVGYQIRLESCMSSLTRLLFCTTGILLKKLENDPFLNDISHVIVDEVHERDEDSDFLLLILKELIRVRTDLKVILMSATLNAELFAKYFNGAPLISIPGKMFPVEEMHLEDILEKCDYTLDEYSKFCRKVNKGLSKQIDSLEYAVHMADTLTASTVSRPNSADECLSASQLYYRFKDYSIKTRKTLLLMDTTKIDPELVINVLTWIVDGDHDYPREGSILVFLPGLSDIINVHDELMNHRLLSPRTGQFIIVPLHSTISNEEQYAVFRKPPRGVRKIVLSTNIAETSITIDDCVFVVDCGKMKVTMFDSNRNMSSLETVWISRANAKQRKGRAGRVMAGLCVRLYTKHRHDYNFTAQPIPEIKRVALDQIILRLKTLQNFKLRTAQEVLQNVLEPPDTNNIDTALERLKHVGALDANCELTALGRHLAALPVDVKIGKLILFGAIFCCLDSVLTIAACLSHKSPFFSPFNKRDAAQAKKKQFAVGNSDHLTMLKAYQKWMETSVKRHWGRQFAQENFLSWRTLETISDLKHQFLELLMSIGFVPSSTNLRRRKHEDRILQVTSRNLNVNGENHKLLAAIICAALYPNLVKILTPGKSYVQSASGAIPKEYDASELKFKTKQDGYVYLHPTSVNHDVATFQSPYLVYQEKMKTSKIFIHDSTMVSIISLILFAGNELKIELCSGLYTVSMENGWLVFSIGSLQDARMLQHMRLELVKLLEKKIEDPALDLVTHPTGKKIISTITHIISNTVS